MSPPSTKTEPPHLYNQFGDFGFDVYAGRDVIAEGAGGDGGQGMSIYGTWFSISDERQIAAQLEAKGINHGVITDDGEVDDLNELLPEMLDAPIVYEGSHVLPSDNARRGGSVEVAAIPNHIECDDRPELPEGSLKDWLRFSVDSLDSEETYEGRPYVRGGSADVVLTRPQIERLRDTLTAWLERKPGTGWEGE